MSAFDNLYKFQHRHADAITTTDAERGMGQDSSGNAQNFLFQRRGYGSIRAGDIFNAAYDRLQSKRTKLVDSFMVGSALTACVLYAGVWVMGPASIGVVATTAAAGVFSLAAAAVTQFRKARSTRLYAKQYDEKGNINKDAPSDASVARGAEKLVRAYLQNADILAAVPFGAGLTTAEPLVKLRDKNQGNRPLSWTEDIFIDAEMVELLLPPPSQRNYAQFCSYVHGRFAQIEQNNPDHVIAADDFQKVAYAYGTSWREIQGTRLLGGMSGATMAIFGPIGCNLMEQLRDKGDMGLSRFVHDHYALTTMGLAATGGLIALYFGARM